MSGIIGVRESRGSGTIRGLRIGDSSVIDDPIVTQGSDATGDVYYRAASGKLTRLATGGDGTVLTSTGAGAVPAFEAIPVASFTWETASGLADSSIEIGELRIQYGIKDAWTTWVDTSAGVGWDYYASDTIAYTGFSAVYWVGASIAGGVAQDGSIYSVVIDSTTQATIKISSARNQGEGEISWIVVGKKS